MLKLFGWIMDLALCGCVWHCVVVFGIVWLCQSAGYETHFTAEFKEGLFAATSKTGIRRWKVTINTDGFSHSNAPSKLKNIYCALQTNGCYVCMRGLDSERVDLKVTNSGLPQNNRVILPAQCVVKREKTRYTLFFIVRPIQTCERITACLTHIHFNPV